METTLIIFRIMASIVNGLLIGLAITVYFYMHRHQQKMKDITNMLVRLFVITMGEHLRHNFDQLKEMKEVLQELIAAERYEDAKRLKAVIDDHAQQTLEELRRFKEEFGDKVIKMDLTKICEPTNEEED